MLFSFTYIINYKQVRKILQICKICQKNAKFVAKFAKKTCVNLQNLLCFFAKFWRDRLIMVSLVWNNLAVWQGGGAIFDRVTGRCGGLIYEPDRVMRRWDHFLRCLWFLCLIIQNVSLNRFIRRWRIIHALVLYHF